MRTGPGNTCDLLSVLQGARSQPLPCSLYAVWEATSLEPKPYQLSCCLGCSQVRTRALSALMLFGIQPVSNPSPTSFHADWDASRFEHVPFQLSCCLGCSQVRTRALLAVMLLGMQPGSNTCPFSCHAAWDASRFEHVPFQLSYCLGCNQSRTQALPAFIFFYPRLLSLLFLLSFNSCPSSFCCP